MPARLMSRFSMPRFSAAVATAALVAMAASTPHAARANAPAPEDPICGARDMLVDRLQQVFAEIPHAAGLGTDGNLVEVFRATDGSWTLLITKPDGVSCVLSAGQSWLQHEQASTKGDAT